MQMRPCYVKIPFRFREWVKDPEWFWEHPDEIAAKQGSCFRYDRETPVYASAFKKAYVYK